MSGRAESVQGQLARAGFYDSTQAMRLLADPILANVSTQWLISKLSKTADPDMALLGYLRLVEAIEKENNTARNVFNRVCENETSARALFAILGYSTALSEILIANPLFVENFSPAQMAKLALSPKSALSRSKENEREILFAEINTYLPPKPQDEKLSADTALTAEKAFKPAVAALRRHYWQRILKIAATDLIAENSVDIFPEISAAITNLIDATLDGALMIARAQEPEADLVEISVIAMGKAGGQEINYISDVDLLYLVARKAEEPKGDLSESGAEKLNKNAEKINNDNDEKHLIAIGTKIVQHLSRIVSEPGDIPSLWEIDPNLRPEGKDGPLVRTLESYLQYYRRWAKSWEFQALLKARPAAGNLELGKLLVAGVAKFVWEVAEKESFVEDSQAMRQRVLDLMPAKSAPRELKLGKGGLRDIEFTVQLLQLVHGRTDENLHVRSTLEALCQLSKRGYISRAHSAQLAQYYKFLRTLEHRIQLFRFRRTHLMPQSARELNRIARSLNSAIAEISDAETLEKYWQNVRKNVHSLHLEIYYRPLIPAVASLSADEVVLEPHAAQARLAAIGYRDSRGALAQIKALTEGISRTALIQRHLLPVLIGWFGAGPNPDQGLRSFRILSEEMGATSWYLRTLRDSAVAAERLAKILSCAKYVADQLPKLPEAISWLDDDELLIPRSFSQLKEELNSLLSRRNEASKVAMAGRYLRRKELLRIAMAQILGLISQKEAQAAISAVAEIAIESGLQAAKMKLSKLYGFKNLPFEFAVIALGRFGGQELSYASDGDVIFVHRPLQPTKLTDSSKNADVFSFAGNESPHTFARNEKSPLLEADTEINGVDSKINLDALACEFARELMNFLGTTAEEPTFEIDAGLRPEGKNGPISRSFESYQEYYARWGELWERQALLRARFSAGTPTLGADFCELIEPLRYPKNSLTSAEIRTIRTMKLRVETERMPRGIDPTRHLKLGPGSLSDIEWTAQYLQLLTAGKQKNMRTTSTLNALQNAEKIGLLTKAELQILQDTWILASRLRDANFLGTGRTQISKIDVLPVDPNDFATIAAILGYQPDKRQNLNDDYLRLARKSRIIMERVFYGENNL